MVLGVDVPFDRGALRRAAFSELARVTPRTIGVKEGAVHLVQEHHRFYLSQAQTKDWGAVFLALVNACNFYNLYWRVQCLTDEAGKASGGFKARTTGQWYTGENAAEALLYAVAASNLILKTDSAEEMGLC